MEWLSKCFGELRNEHLIVVFGTVVLVIWLSYKLMSDGQRYLSLYRQEEVKEHIRVMDGFLSELKKVNELQTRQTMLMERIIRHQELCPRFTKGSER